MPLPIPRSWLSRPEYSGDVVSPQDAIFSGRIPQPGKINHLSMALRTVGYDPDTLTLYVAFQPSPKRPNPALYAYDGVPAVAHDTLMNAPSAGAYLCAWVKGVYPYRRLPDLSEGDYHALTSPFATVVALLGMEVE